MAGPIPAELGKLDRLVELNLSMNDMTAAIPKEIAGAVSLERLYLQCNGLVGTRRRVIFTFIPPRNALPCVWS